FFGAGPGHTLDPELVRAGFAAVDNPGRLERLSSSPTVLVDAAHNGHGGRALAEAVTSEFDFRRLVAVVAMLDGKDTDAFLAARWGCRSRRGRRTPRASAGWSRGEWWPPEPPAPSAGRTRSDRAAPGGRAGRGGPARPGPRAVGRPVEGPAGDHGRHARPRGD